MILFTMINEVDAAVVTLEAESDKPYTVRVKFEDRAISTNDSEETFEEFQDAAARFNALVANEVGAVFDSSAEF